jgi:KTSC domain
MLKFKLKLKSIEVPVEVGCDRTEKPRARCRSMAPTAIVDIEYDPGNERLIVKFVTGRTYEYVDVPREVAASFQSAFSKPTFFNIYIGDRYDFREITPAL